jgi:hypothetical protein
MKIIGIIFANIFFGLVFLILSLSANAAIYKWVDEKGLTHYSDTRDPALDNQQKIDEAMPVIHGMEKPSARLTEIQRASVKERRQRHLEKDVAQTSTAVRQKLRRCESLQRQLHAIQARLRNGYREPRGNNLRERRREIQTRLNSQCR